MPTDEQPPNDPRHFHTSSIFLCLMIVIGIAALGASYAHH